MQDDNSIWYVHVFCNGKWCGGSRRHQPRNWVGAVAAGVLFTLKCFIERRSYYGFCMYYWTINKTSDAWAEPKYSDLSS